MTKSINVFINKFALVRFRSAKDRISCFSHERERDKIIQTIFYVSRLKNDFQLCFSTLANVRGRPVHRPQQHPRRQLHFGRWPHLRPHGRDLFLRLHHHHLQQVQTVQFLTSIKRPTYIFSFKTLYRVICHLISVHVLLKLYSKILHRYFTCKIQPFSLI